MQPQQDSPIPEPANPAVPPAPFTLPDSVAATQAAPAATQASTDGPQLADDGDLIEKEWVAQVKHIISTTGNDPFEQSQQIARLKADYMQKRYGKVIKTEE